MQSLKTKILITTSVIVILVVAIVSVTNLKLEKKLISNLVERDTRVLAETIRNSISNSMRHGRSDEVGSILSRIKSGDTISSIRIIADDGKILNSADPSEISRNSNISQYSGYSNKQEFQLIQGTHNGTFVAFAQIYNAPSCYGCHPQSNSVLGTLQVSLSLEYLQSFYSQLKVNMIASTAVIILLLIIAFSFFLIHYVDKPLNKLSNSMKRLETGDFDCDITLDSSREMFNFSRHFNTMLSKLKQNMDKMLDQERRIAVNEEQLVHHHEISGMNNRLETQLKEIEALNNDLTRKLEEIEEANYKISDLAGELEDKNTILESTVSRLSTLYRIGLGINSIMEPEKLYEMIISNTIEALKAEVGYITLLAVDKEDIAVKHLTGTADCQEITAEERRISKMVVKNGKPFILDGITAKISNFENGSKAIELKSLICVPLRVHTEVIGTIVIANMSDESSFQPDDIDLLSTIASQAGIAIKNAMLYQDLQQAYFNTIQALVSAIEASDSYTRGHSERVTRYALNLARRINQPVDRIKILEKAAVLHDIGKIGIDLSLLHKTGQLSPEDIENLKQHPTIGVKIIDPISFLNDVKICIGQHHERFDGKGYPNCISSDELLLESRILSIADDFDAMTSNRPYRKALDVDTALKELNDHAGTQFDPDLVEQFIEMVRNGSLDLRESRNLKVVSV